MDDNSETLISELPDAVDAYHKIRKVEPQSAFKALQDKGIHLTSFVERDGAGRITRSYSDSSSCYN